MKRLFVCCGLALLAAGCVSGPFEGISLAPGAASPELQQLAKRAEDGDKSALLALGIKFEEGRDVPRDLARAERLYERAATSEPSYAYLTEVPVSKHGVSGVRRVQDGVSRPGLPEARRRLEALRQSRSQP